MFAVFLLLLLPHVASVPSPSRPTPKYCRRCCDHLDPPLNPAPHPAANQTPEIRTIINMTILKGKTEPDTPIRLVRLNAALQRLAAS